MLEFQTIERKSWIGEMTWSQCLALGPFILLFFFALYGEILSKFFHSTIEIKDGTSNLLIFVFIICLLFGTVSNMSPVTYENLNAFISGEVIFDEKYISVNDEIINLDEISKLNVKANFYKGQHILPSVLYSRIYEPYFQIGKNNFVEITTKNNKEIKAEFLINSKYDIETLNDYFAKTVIDNRINLDIDKLYNLPENVKSTQYFKNFVADLLIKKEIECGYGISLIGYNSDQEAKILREKYCS